MGDLVLSNLGYLLGGYAVFIGVTLVYIYSLVSRQKRLEQEMQTLQAINEQE